MAAHPLGVIRFVDKPSFESVAKKLGLAPRKFSDWRPVWEQLLPMLIEGLRQNIEGQGAPIGVSWAPLLTATIIKKHRRAQTSAPLIGFGTALGRIGGKYSITKRRVRAAPKDAYMFIQARGSRTRAQHLPARDFIAIPPAVVRIAMNLMDARARSIVDELAAEISRG